jgi:hypothetical protein
MVKITKINDGSGTYTIFETSNFEYLNPIEHFSNILIETEVSIKMDIYKLKNPSLNIRLIEDHLRNQAISYSKERLEKAMQIIIPKNLISLLTTRSKKEQLSLLKGLSINPEELLAFILKSYLSYGYLFSQYTSEHHHNGLEVEDMPKLVEIKDDKVNKVGNTSLTDGQLKQAVNHRKVIVAKFIDKEDEWHCLFLTYESIRGKESWNGGKPHYHYISDKFGIPRAEVLSQLKSRTYNLGSLPHIELTGYRDEKQ